VADLAIDAAGLDQAALQPSRSLAKAGKHGCKHNMITPMGRVPFGNLSEASRFAVLLALESPLSRALSSFPENQVSLLSGPQSHETKNWATPRLLRCE
jgi:hypothetical protein